VLAVPVAPADWAVRLSGEADEFVCVESPASFTAIGYFYRDFAQTTDEEVSGCLARAGRAAAVVSARNRTEDRGARDGEVDVPVDGRHLAGRLTVPSEAIGVVVFAHGSGSSRHSPRNQFVAARLHQAGLGTLLFDLLTPEEELDRSKVFNVELLARRLVDATAWLRAELDGRDLPVGFFGASTGAAAALGAAAEPDVDVAAVVSRGGRSDLAGRRLASVTAPTLLIVGGRDRSVLDLNRQAQARLLCESRLVVVPGATHLFEEPGTLATVAELARDWFVRHMDADAAVEAASGPDRRWW
jgi:putative phosphoribosyl transferase